MLRKLSVFALFALSAALSTTAFSPTARAADAEPAAPAPSSSPVSAMSTAPAAPLITVRMRTYSLAECLAMAERNHPNLWAARARLAVVHAQLDEAKWTPFSQFSAGAAGGVAPAFNGTAIYTSAPLFVRNVSSLSNLAPFFALDVNGTVPIYTFGKISAIREAAEAQVRVSEWDLEKVRQSVRMDTRRAYFGLLLAREAKYVLDDAISRLDKAIEGLKKRVENDDKAVSRIDVFRLQYYREEITARSGEPMKGETYALAALRFFTGVQTAFDISDESIKRPEKSLGPVVQYLTAARLFRPEINMARAGIEARRKLVDYQRARLYPDFGLGLNFGYGIAPGVPQQTSAFVGDSGNRFGYLVAFGMRWNLDLLPQSARVSQAESQLEETRALSRLAIGGAMVEVENAYGTALEAKVREEAWDRAEHKAKQWASTIQDGVDLGTRDERELLEPLRTYGNARINHLYALMDLNVAMANLTLAAGLDASPAPVH